MIPKGNLQSNVERFTGFANVYDSHRPEAPEHVVQLLTQYLGRRPALVADIGCGTGLSTFVWQHAADQVIGIEPNEDMIRFAKEKLPLNEETESSISFISGYSNQLALQDESVDIVTCSQSFHWMEPVSTLAEIGRVLKPGGIFAAYDCDWPPSASWEAEDRFLKLHQKADRLASELSPEEKQAQKSNKEKHLLHLRESGVFRYTREIVFHNTEQCDAARYMGLALSQGGVQTVFKLGSDQLTADIEALQAAVQHYFQEETRDIWFSYRMRIGVK